MGLEIKVNLWFGDFPFFNLIFLFLNCFQNQKKKKKKTKGGGERQYGTGGGKKKKKQDGSSQ